MTQLLLEAENMEKGIEKKHHISRLTKVKEEHAEIVKNEVRIIWGDYFKDEQIQKTPNVHELVHNIMMSASKCKQEINLDESKKLLSLVQAFAEAFYKTKDMQIRRIPSGFPTDGDIVSHE
jgi:nickel superoxide dismutase